MWQSQVPAGQVTLGPTKNIASISGFSRDWLNSEQGVAPTPPPAAFRSSSPPRVCALARLLSTIATTIVVIQGMVFPRVQPQNIPAPSPVSGDCAWEGAPVSAFGLAAS